MHLPVDKKVSGFISHLGRISSDRPATQPVRPQIWVPGYFPKKAISVRTGAAVGVPGAV